MTLDRDLAVTGAMLVRLLDVGALGGLSAAATLLHVLDGVPLPAAISPEASAALLERIRQAGPGPVVGTPGPALEAETDEDGSLCFEFPEADDPAQQDRLDALNAEAIERELGPECWSGQSQSWTPAKGSKAAQALDLWSTTQLSYDAIAGRIGSTREAVRSVVKKAKERGEPRAARPALVDDPIRAQVIAEALALPLKRDQALLLWQRTSLRPGEIAEIIGSTGPSVSNAVTEARHKKSEQVRDGDRLRGMNSHRADEPAGHAGEPEETAPATAGGEDDLTHTHDPGQTGAAGEPADRGDDPAALLNLPERASEGPRSQVQILPGSSVASEGAPVAQPGRAGQNGDAGSNPARNLPDSSVVRAPSDSPDGAEEECAEPVVEPNPPGPLDGTFPAPHEVATPIEMGTVRQESVEAAAPAVETPLDTADRPAGPGLYTTGPVDQAIDAMVAGLERKAAETAPPARTEALLEVYGGTTQLQKDIGAKLGLSGPEVSTILKMYRARQDQRVVAGDAARAALKAAPAPPPPPAPASGSQPPGDLVELKHDQVLAIDRGWIVGPAGSVKGFPLVNGALAALAGGDLLPAGVVAQRSGARSAEAVLSQLQFWREDLGRIGVEYIKVGAADVRLRRIGGT